MMRFCLIFTAIQRLEPYVFTAHIDDENLRDFYSNSKARALPFIRSSDHENLLDLYSN